MQYSVVCFHFLIFLKHLSFQEFGPVFPVPQTDLPGVFAQDLTLYLCWDDESEEHLDSTILSNSMTTRDEGKERPKKRKAPSTSDSEDEA